MFDNDKLLSAVIAQVAHAGLIVSNGLPSAYYYTEVEKIINTTLPDTFDELELDDIITILAEDAADQINEGAYNNEALAQAKLFLNDSEDIDVLKDYARKAIHLKTAELKFMKGYAQLLQDQIPHGEAELTLLKKAYQKSLSQQGLFINERHIKRMVSAISESFLSHQKDLQTQQFQSEVENAIYEELTQIASPAQAHRKAFEEMLLQEGLSERERVSLLTLYDESYPNQVQKTLSALDRSNARHTLKNQQHLQQHIDQARDLHQTESAFINTLYKGRLAVSKVKPISDTAVNASEASTEKLYAANNASSIDQPERLALTLAYIDCGIADGEQTAKQLLRTFEDRLCKAIEERLGKAISRD